MWSLTPPTGQDGYMPEAVTVWMVPLTRGAVVERKGVLSLDDSAVVFVESKAGAEHRFRAGSLSGAKRVRGSPVLILVHRDGADARQTAFYFAQPPPLTAPDPATGSLPSSGLGRPMGPFGAARRTSKRRHMRSNLTYLTMASPTSKREIQAWVDEIRKMIGSGRR